MNVVEWVLNLAAILVALAIFSPTLLDAGAAHIVAAVAAFCAWFNYLLYLQRFNSFGIYVVMFLEILSTLLRVLSVFSVLIIAFGLSFYILMWNMVSEHRRQRFSDQLHLNVIACRAQKRRASIAHPCP